MLIQRQPIMKKKEIQLSKEFKIQAFKSILAISLFVLIYFLFLALALLLTVLCIGGGVMLITLKPMLFTIALGIGLASLGVFVLIFLIKYFFKSHINDRSHLIEINLSEEPHLYKMINEIVLEVGTSFPKKVYLSADVNASVFYDSNFWSMFLPIKKNLQIGIGMVNTLTKEELKAVLAHEFGHFSQRTMKVGSYVYNVNQVIYNMLNYDESYNDIIQKWANFGGYISLFVALALHINQGLKWVFRKLYEVINKSYMGLSREMEFHADEIAASVTGYEPLKRSLLRMTLADISFNNVLNFYNNKISDNVKSENIYNDHMFVVRYLAVENNLNFINNLPDVSLEDQNKYNKSKLVIKDQWASHPSTSDRIKRLEKTGYSESKNSEIPANELFVDILRIQKMLTDKVFEVVKYQGEVITMATDKFSNEYTQEIVSNSFSKIYNGYYDNKNPTCFDLKEYSSNENSICFDDLYSEGKIDLVYTSISLQQDIQTIRDLFINSTAFKTFDYDGQKYKRKHAIKLIEKINIDLNNILEKIKKNDVEIFNYFNQLDKKYNNQSELEKIYEDFFVFDKEFDSKYEIYTKLVNAFNIINVETSIVQIKINFVRIRIIEKSLKNEISLLLSDTFISNEITQEIRDNFDKYISQTWEYFEGDSYLNDNLNILYAAMHNYSYLLSKKYLIKKKTLLNYQEDLMNKCK